MDKPGISAAARRLLEEDVMVALPCAEVIHRPGRLT
jgi:hypothetical protein